MHKIIENNSFSPMVLIIMDGWGISKEKFGNAIYLAKTPFLNSLYEKYPNTLLCASSSCVGLPNGQDGNSEAGHENIGAGRVVEQDALWINRTIKTSQFFKNPAFKETLFHCRKNKSHLHLMGLLSTTDSAHSQPGHLYSLIKLIRKCKKEAYLHLFTDGRDSAPHQAIPLLAELRNHLKGTKIKIATISGRFYAMDRTKKWDRTEKAYNAMILGEGLKANSIDEAIANGYSQGLTDEYIYPTVICEDNKKPIATIKDNDAVIFFNLRSDRARQLTKPFAQKGFESKGGFKRKKALKNLFFVTLTDFGPDLDHIVTAYPSSEVKEALPAVLNEFKQLYIAETEKYAHVTYFFNGGFANPVAGEDRKIIPSPKVFSYDQKPDMSIYEVTDYIIKDLKNKKHDFITVNLCNPDMVGHTGNLKAGIEACEHVDACINKIVQEVLNKNGTAMITADHGNVEEMLNLKTGGVDTKHSTNPVPFILVNNNFTQKNLKLIKNGKLANIAPTILELLKVKKPAKMSGKSLIKP